MKLITVVSGIVWIFAVTSCAPVLALPVYYAEANLGGGPVWNQDDVVAGAELVFPVDSSGNSALASAQASVAGLFASGYGRVAEGTRSGSGYASARFDDFVIQGPAGPITTSFNMLLSGNLGVLTKVSDGTSLTQASAAVIVEVIVNDQFVTADPFFQDRYRLYSLNGGLEIQPTGMLAKWSPTLGVITTPLFTVNAGVPFSLQIGLRAVGGAFGYAVDPNAFHSEGFSDFAHTLQFAAGPVFNLPAGYDANSPTGGVVGNQFVVPEPRTWVLLTAGVVGLGCARRHRLRRPHYVRSDCARAIAGKRHHRGESS